MKSIIFDTGPIISLATNNLLFILDPLKQEFKGSFLITQKVKREVIDRPFEMKKFKFEALQVMSYINKRTLEVIEKELKEETNELLEIANSCFRAKGMNLNIVHPAELEAVAAAVKFGSSAVVIDERTTRSMIEDPEELKKLLSYRLHTNVEMDKGNIKKLMEKTKGVKFIRSSELVVMAYELGLLDKFMPNMPEARKQLIQAALWGLKIRGCAISQKEIDTLVNIETRL